MFLISHYLEIVVSIVISSISIRELIHWNLSSIIRFFNTILITILFLLTSHLFSSSIYYPAKIKIYSHAKSSTSKNYHDSPSHLIITLILIIHCFFSTYLSHTPHHGSLSSSIAIDKNYLSMSYCWSSLFCRMIRWKSFMFC